MEKSNLCFPLVSRGISQLTTFPKGEKTLEGGVRWSGVDSQDVLELAKQLNNYNYNNSTTTTTQQLQQTYTPTTPTTPFLLSPTLFHPLSPSPTFSTLPHPLYPPLPSSYPLLSSLPHSSSPPDEVVILQCRVHRGDVDAGVVLRLLEVLVHHRLCLWHVRRPANLSRG